MADLEGRMARDLNTTHAAIDAAVVDADAGTSGLKRTIGTVPLVAMGVAAVVGAGIFVVTGEAAATKAGPAVVIAFIIAGIVAGFSALSYSELAGMIPLAGSTYSYAYAALGAFVAWVIGWDLLVEYLFGAANVANGWSSYFANLAAGAGVDLPPEILNPPVSGSDTDVVGWINLPAVILVLLITLLLISGAKESARATTFFVIVKIGTLLLFVLVGVFAVTGSNYEPFVPPNEGNFQAFGWSGVLAAAGIVFYGYISFDVVCTAAQEAKNPRRSVPIGVLGSLGIATVLYVAVGAVLVGLVSYTLLNTPNALSAALDAVNLGWVGDIVDIGAVIGLGASVLALLYGQTRILMRMSQDAMLPSALGRVASGRGTPTISILICGIAAAIMSGLLPSSILVELVSIGTLLAFIIVSVAVIVLRKTRPDLPRNFKVPGGYTFPILSIVTSLIIMMTLPFATWLRLLAWLAIGLVIYFTYSKARAGALLDERAAEQPEALVEEFAEEREREREQAEERDQKREKKRDKRRDDA